MRLQPKKLAAHSPIGLVGLEYKGNSRMLSRVSPWIQQIQLGTYHWIMNSPAIGENPSALQGLKHPSLSSSRSFDGEQREVVSSDMVYFQSDLLGGHFVIPVHDSDVLADSLTDNKGS